MRYEKELSSPESSFFHTPVRRPGAADGADSSYSRLPVMLSPKVRLCRYSAANCIFVGLNPGDCGNRKYVQSGVDSVMHTPRLR